MEEKKKRDFVAEQTADVDLCQQFIALVVDKKKDPVAFRDVNGDSLLSLACKYGDVDSVERLIKYGQTLGVGKEDWFSRWEKRERPP